MTKKFVNALARDGGAAGRARFLIPALDESTQFEEIGTGKRHDMGYLVYTGKELSPDDVAKKCAVEDTQSAGQMTLRSRSNTFSSSVAYAETKLGTRIYRPTSTKGFSWPIWGSSSNTSKTFTNSSATTKQ